MSIVLHRWEYNPALRLTECMPLPFGGVESHQYCIGCGIRVTDEELCKRGFPRDRISCDLCTPEKAIEEGTLEAYKFRKGRM